MLVILLLFVLPCFVVKHIYIAFISKRCDDKVLYSKHVHVALWINSEKKSSNDTIVCYPSPKRYENGKRKVQCNENLSVQKYIYKLVWLATSILQIFLWSKKKKKVYSSQLQQNNRLQKTISSVFYTILNQQSHTKARISVYVSLFLKFVSCIDKSAPCKDILIYRSDRHW